jgi:uncharacterized membrane protein YgcG
MMSRIQQCNDEMNNRPDDYSVIEAMISRETTAYDVHDDYFAQTLLSLSLSSSLSSSSSSLSSNSSRSSNQQQQQQQQRRRRSCDVDVVDSSCRFVMTKWCISLCNFCNYNTNRGRLVSSIMSCVDRFVSTKRGRYVLFDRERYQLVVMSSLYVQAKIHQSQALNPTSISKLSRGKFTKDDIEQMECEILTTLQWNINPPTSNDYVNEILNHLLNDDNVDDDEKTTTTRIIALVHCQIDEATCDYELSCLYRPSHVAFAAILNALESINNNNNNNNKTSDDDSDNDDNNLALLLLQKFKSKSKLYKILQIGHDIDNNNDNDQIRNICMTLLNVVSSSVSSSSSRSSSENSNNIGGSGGGGGDSSHHHNQVINTLLAQRKSSQHKINSNNNKNIKQSPTTPTLNSTMSSTCIHSSPRSVVHKIHS